MDEFEWEEIFNFLSYQTYPARILKAKIPRYAKKNFLTKMASYQIKDEKLFKVSNSNWLECPKKDQLSKILLKYHDVLGHIGINATFTSISKKYYWKHISHDVREYVQTCHTCQITGSKPPNPQRELKPIPPPDRPWKHVGVDLIVDVPSVYPDTDGYLHILVIVCYLSKYILARPLFDRTTDSVIAALQDIYLEVGVPDIIQHDQGKEFSSKAFQNFTEKLNIDDRSTTAYHPQANGLVEAHNKILEKKLVNMEAECKCKWSRVLKPAVLIMNSTRKRSTKYTPFELMFNRESNHIDLLEYLHYNTSISENDEEHLDDNQPAAIKEGEKFVSRNITKDKKLPGTKLQPNYKGPFIATKTTDSHVLTTNPKTGSEVKIPVLLTKPYFPRDQVSKEEQKEEGAYNVKKRKLKHTKGSVKKKIRRGDEEINFVYGIPQQDILDKLQEFKLHKNYFIYLNDSLTLYKSHL